MPVVRKQDVQQECGICHRTLLLGEQTTRYTPGHDEWVEVCALCADTALERGWIREGSAASPIVSYAERRRRRFGLATLGGLVDSRRAEPEATIVPEPMLRRLSKPEQDMVEAAELFNASSYRRTVAGIQKSLGEPKVSLLSLSGSGTEVVITVAWDISWYRYRVALDGSPAPVKLGDRGYELDELDERFRGWNGYLEEQGRVVPDIPRV
jgi:hypothetical protein